MEQMSAVICGNGGPWMPDEGAKLRVEIRSAALPGESYERAAQAGQTILEVLDEIVPEGAIDNVLVYLDSSNPDTLPEYVPQKNWHTVRPKPTATVIIEVVPEGGGFKKILRSILMIGILVFAFWAGPALVGQLGVQTLQGLTMTSVGFGLNALHLVTFAATGLIGFAGMSLLNAIIPPSLPKIDAPDQAKTSINFNNAARPGEPMPVIFGKLRYFPPLGAQMYTETVGDDVYVRALFMFGYGPLELSDFKIGDNPIEDYEDYQLEVINGYPDDPASPQLFSNDVTETTFATALDTDNEVIVTTAVDANEAQVDIGFDSLVEMSSKGKRLTRSVTFTVHYRKVGDTNWLEPNKPAPTGVYYTLYGTSGLYSNGPTRQSQYTFSNNVQEPRRYTVSLVFDEPAQYQIRVIRTTADGSTDDQIYDDATLTALRTIKHQSPITRSGFCSVALRIRMTDQLSGGVQTFNAIAQRLYPTWNGTEFVEPVEGAIVEGNRTRTAAAAYMFALRGPMSADAAPDSSLNTASLIDDWAAACEADSPQGDEYWLFDHVVQGQSTGYDILALIAATGRAVPSLQDGSYGVTRDVVQAARVQLFTPRNSRDFTGEIVYGENPHGLRVTYLDADLDYSEKTVIAYRDGYSSSNATRIVDVALPGITRRSQALREARYHLAAHILRPEAYRFKTGAEAMVCVKGDRIGVQHDLPEFGVGTARVISTDLNNDGEVLGVVLDDEIYLDPAESHTAVFRLDQSTDRFAAVALETGVGGSVDALVFTTAQTLDGLAGSLVGVQSTSQEIRDLIVKEITPTGDPENMEWEIHAVDYNEAIQSADTDAIPAYDPGVVGQKIYEPPAAVRQLGLSEILTIQGSAPVSSIAASWQPGPGPIPNFYEVYLNLVAGWKLITTTEATSAILPYAVNLEETYEVAVLSVGRGPDGNNLKLPISRASTATLTITGDDGPPPAVDDGTFKVSRLADGTRRFSWEQADPPADLEGYEIRYATGFNVAWESCTALFTAPLKASPVESNELAAGSYTFRIKTVDTAGNYSATSRLINATLGDPRLKDVILQRLETVEGYDGTLTDCWRDGNTLRAEAATGQDWDDLPATWAAMADEWRDIVTHKNPITYETPVIDLTADVVFTPLVTVTGTGSPSITMRYHTAAQGSDLSSASYGALGAKTGRYVQLKIVMSDSVTTQPTIEEITTLIDSETVTEEYDDIDTATESATWFNKIADGHFEVGSKGALNTITAVNVLALQGNVSGYTTAVISKVKTVNGEVAAELKIWDSNGVLADATIDLELRGPAIATDSGASNVFASAFSAAFG